MNIDFGESAPPHSPAGWHGELPISVVDPNAGRPTPTQPGPPGSQTRPGHTSPEPGGSNPDPAALATRGPTGSESGTELLPLDSLMLRPVRSGRLRIGTVVDVVLNASLKHVLGVDVVHRGRRRFFPWIALRPGTDDLTLTPAAALCRPDGLGLLLSHGVRLSQTCHRPTLVVDRLGEIQSL